MKTAFQRPNITGMTAHQRFLLQQRLHREFLERLRQQTGTGLLPNDKRWKAIDQQLISILGDVIFEFRDRKDVIEDAVKHILKHMPKLAEEVAELATSNPELIRTCWFPRLLEIVAFAEYGVKVPRITERYLDLLMTGQRGRLKELTEALRRREGSTSKHRCEEKTAVESEAGLTLMKVRARLADVSASTVKDFHSYLRTTFRNNVLDALHYDDVSLPMDNYGKTPWAKKLERRKKQSLDELQEFDEEKAKAVLKDFSAPSPEEIAINSEIDPFELIPESRQKKVAILRYVEGLTQAEAAKELNVTERTVRADEEKIKARLRKQLTP
jgi:RNA polymerase sigma factor (sigma-70 family)